MDKTYLAVSFHAFPALLGDHEGVFISILVASRMGRLISISKDFPPSYSRLFFLSPAFLLHHLALSPNQWLLARHTSQASSSARFGGINTWVPVFSLWLGLEVFHARRGYLLLFRCRMSFPFFLFFFFTKRRQWNSGPLDWQGKKERLLFLDGHGEVDGKRSYTTTRTMKLCMISYTCPS